jgi:hypothetical protein
MNNLIKINSDKVVRNGVEVVFENYAIGSYTGDTICIVKIWGKYVTKLDKAYYFERSSKTMEEQFKFVDSLIADEINNSSREIEKQDGSVEIHFPFVTATISETKFEETYYSAIIEKINSSVSYLSLGVFFDLESAKLSAYKNAYQWSKDEQSEENTKIWQRALKE